MEHSDPIAGNGARQGKNKAAHGKVVVVVGGQWGDEGKGKIVDFLAEKADVVARGTGGNNAGHTVVVGPNKFNLHLIPSGIIHPGTLNICGNGMVIYPRQLVREIEELRGRGVPVSEKNLIISSSAHVITEEHIKTDQNRGKKIGTTGRGIGPCYTAKVERTGIRVCDFLRAGGTEAEKLRPFVQDTYIAINRAIDEGKNILLEGAQGTMLDIDHGTYPYVTSSNSSAGGLCTGLGIGPTKISSVIGVLKAYTTRVGRGPFPTELGTEQETEEEDRDSSLTEEDIERANLGEEYYVGKLLRKRGREYGTTTGRPRRTGWFDAVVSKYAATINAFTSIALTKLDCLSDLRTIKICTAYRVNGARTVNFPVDTSVLSRVEPVYEEMDGWQTDISGAKSLSELPEEARAYVRRIEEITGVPISILSLGPKRAQTIILKKDDLF